MGIYITEGKNEVEMNSHIKTINNIFPAPEI